VLDGTIGGLIKVYLTHPYSPFHEKRQKTQQTYQYYLKELNRAVGERLLSQLDGIDFRRSYQQFKEPKQGGIPERISRAHHLTEMLRIVFSFGVELGLPDAKRLRDALSAIRFPNAPAPSGCRSRHRYSEQL